MNSFVQSRRIAIVRSDKSDSLDHEERSLADNLERLALANSIISDVTESLRARSVIGLSDESTSLRVLFARSLIRGRAASRAAFNGIQVFTSPCWDMLLDMYVSEAIGKPVCITDIAIGSGCPQTTALRWIQVLIEAGLLERKPDRRDNRRSFLTLTHDGLSKMEAALDSFLID